MLDTRTILLATGFGSAGLVGLSFAAVLRRPRP
jgi:hypothetical protein